MKKAGILIQTCGTSLHGSIEEHIHLQEMLGEQIVLPATGMWTEWSS